MNYHDKVAMTTLGGAMTFLTKGMTIPSQGMTITREGMTNYAIVMPQMGRYDKHKDCHTLSIRYEIHWTCLPSSVRHDNPLVCHTF